MFRVCVCVQYFVTHAGYAMIKSRKQCYMQYPSTMLSCLQLPLSHCYPQIQHFQCCCYILPNFPKPFPHLLPPLTPSCGVYLETPAAHLRQTDTHTNTHTHTHTHTRTRRVLTSWSRCRSWPLVSSALAASSAVLTCSMSGTTSPHRC